jgi:predicted component of type VI protein secretion system
MQTMSATILRLSILARRGEALPHGASARFDAQGGSIGSDPDNTLVLDGDDLVAARHAAVHLEHGVWRLSNTSLQMAIAHNGRLLPPRESAPLRDGDIVNIGAYVLRAGVEEAVPGWHAPAEPRAAASVASYAGASPGDDGLPHGLADLLDTPVDPLALFGTPQAMWDGYRGTADSTGAQLDNWIADLSGTPARSAAARPDTVSPLRDAAPEFLSHIRIAPVAEPVVAEPVVAELQAEAAARSYGATFGVPVRPQDAPTYTLRDPATDSRPVVQGGIGFPQGELSHAIPTLTDPLVFAAPGAPNLPLLAQAFLDGAGIAAADAEAAGFTPEYMRGLGALARGLKLLLPDR